VKALDILNIKPNNPDLYKRAMTHSSYAHENNTIDNERLEFLGDAVLDLIASEFLYKNQYLSEGEMTKMRSALVCTDALYEYAQILHLEEDILLGVGETKNPANHRSILANTTEALIAAIYLDQGFEKVKRVIFELLQHGNLEPNDYKSKLQELVQTTKKSIHYELVSESGPAHDKIFTVEVKIDNMVYGSGTAGSKKEAEQLAAKVALEKAAN